jgi:hypothetical protein
MNDEKYKQLVDDCLVSFAPDLCNSSDGRGTVVARKNPHTEDDYAGGNAGDSRWRKAIEDPIAALLRDSVAHRQ